MRDELSHDSLMEDKHSKGKPYGLYLNAQGKIGIHIQLVFFFHERMNYIRPVY